MQGFKIIRNPDGDITHIETNLLGYDLLSHPKLNKGCAFTRDEREIFQLTGLLPHQVETLEQQVARMYAQYLEKRTNLDKYIYLNVLHDYNETLFYQLTSRYLEEMLPIIYTPTVGDAVEHFSSQHRKSRGLYISYPDIKNIDHILKKYLSDDIDLIVVTDGEAVLGIGDQGIGGINIAVAKLAVYTLCAGINPHRMLPIQLDVGTNNQHLLADPMYLGWRHERIEGAPYDEFIATFVKAIKQKCPRVFLHWEDVGRENARRILTHYRDEICTFNGDMQGTGAVTLAALLAAAQASKIKLVDQQIIIFGAGTAGVGIADQIISVMQRQGLSKKQAYKKLWLIDRDGLLTEHSRSLLSFQKPYARDWNDCASWPLNNPENITLLDVIRHVKPTTLIGCSTKGGAFTEEIVKLMASHVEHPIIMPLSNPTIKSEATPQDLMHWTQGHAIIATGSPYPNVDFAGKSLRISQSNNALSYPGIGLGAIAVKAKHLTDGMLWAATDALSQCAPIMSDPQAPLLPKLSETKSISRQVALAVALEACKEGLVQDKNVDLNQALNQVTWEPHYYPYKKIA